MSDVWTIVLAAGAGRRLASLTGGVPKQFWPGPGGRSLLSETLARFATVADPSHTVVIADGSHRTYLRDDDGRRGIVIYQPHDRGTAAGVLLALSPVLASDPDSIVVITPSDHGVADTGAFLKGIAEGIEAVRRTNEIVVYGVEPSAARDDYGWILPGRPTPHAPLRSIAHFVEKPDMAIAEQLLRHGAAWNTMVMAARARHLRDLCFGLVPPLEAAFARYLAPARDKRPSLDGVYGDLRHYDLSRDVLAPARNLVTYIWPAEMEWSDLGTPERMLAWHQRRGRLAGCNTVTAA